MSPPPTLELCSRARDLARLQGRRRAWALRVVADPVEVAGLCQRLAGRSYDLLWRGDDDWLLALGVAGSWRSHGPDRHASIARRATALALRMVLDAPVAAPALPLLILRAAFADQGPDDGIWGRDGGGSRLCLPAVAWWSSDGRCWRIEAREVAAAADDAELAAIAAGFEALPEEPAADTTPPWPALELPDYSRLVAAARSLLEHGAMRKVVLCRAEDEHLPAAIDREALLRVLMARGDRRSWCYSLSLGGARHFSGLSPETLLSCQGDDWRSWALAGSRRRDEDPQRDSALADELMASTKERKEHQLVVEHLLTCLRPRSQHCSAPDRPLVRRLRHIQHLETEVHGRFHDDDHLSLLDDLHPSPAVCGLPAALAEDWIHHHEGLDRGLYSGLFGFHSPGRCELGVALRGALVDGDQARLFAGAGIVERSEPEEELAETAVKLTPMRKALAEAG